MADLLTHVLVPFLLLTPASWRVERLDPRWIVVAMCGAAIPDLVKIGIVVDQRLVESLLGLPFSYAPISTLGGVVVIAGGIAIFFESRRRTAFGWLLGGGLSSLVLDGLRVFADGRANSWLYPFTWWRPPTPSLYVTSDFCVTVVAVTAAVVVVLVGRYYVTPE